VVLFICIRESPIISEIMQAKLTVGLSIQRFNPACQPVETPHAYFFLESVVYSTATQSMNALGWIREHAHGQLAGLPCKPIAANEMFSLAIHGPKLNFCDFKMMKVPNESRVFFFRKNRVYV